MTKGGFAPPSNLAQICLLSSLVAKNIAFFTDFGLFLPDYLENNIGAL